MERLSVAMNGILVGTLSGALSSVRNSSHDKR